MQVCSTQSRILGIHYYARGYQTGPEKIIAIINIERPKDKKKFLCMVQYYCDLWPKRIGILAPLKEWTKCVPTKTSPPMESSLYQGISTNEITHLQGDHPRLSGFFKKITIHTDTSDVQLGAAIKQEGKPLAFYSQKLSKAQIN